MKLNKFQREQDLRLATQKQKQKLKPFDITFQVRSVDEAKMLLLMFESSPTVFNQVIDEIYEKVKIQGFVI